MTTAKSSETMTDKFWKKFDCQD